ncbi:hypothetical protein F4Z99_03545, partial [Candidatus Poribacteria bacterium]|nr:hypothetical protein [Candidatus Poribacteria bacterium]
MVTEDDIMELEKLVGQLKSLHTEIGILSRKSPNDAVNEFKLKLINKTIARTNNLLISEFIPYEDFTEFEKDDCPSNSDVILVISQYLEEVERFRNHHIVWCKKKLSYVYKLNGESSKIQAEAPSW